MPLVCCMAGRGRFCFAARTEQRILPAGASYQAIYWTISINLQCYYFAKSDWRQTVRERASRFAPPHFALDQRRQACDDSEEEDKGTRPAERHGPLAGQTLSARIGCRRC